jgi:hypothetical protein
MKNFKSLTTEYIKYRVCQLEQLMDIVDIDESIYEDIVQEHAECVQELERRQ